MEWISVKDVLPPMNTLVLCLKKSMGYCIGSYLGAKYSDEYAAFKHSEKDMAFGVSHWMPLPEPPEIIKVAYCPLCDKTIEISSNISIGHCPVCGHRLALRDKE